jgi:hypothetical protein
VTPADDYHDRMLANYGDDFYGDDEDEDEDEDETDTSEDSE